MIKYTLYQLKKKQGVVRTIVENIRDWTVKGNEKPRLDEHLKLTNIWKVEKNYS